MIHRRRNCICVYKVMMTTGRAAAFLDIIGCSWSKRSFTDNYLIDLHQADAFHYKYYDFYIIHLLTPF